MNIKYPTGLYFAPGARALAATLFNRGGTASGYYTRERNGFLFSRPNGEPWFFLVNNRHGERFFVSCGKQSDGRTVYFHSLDSVTETALFGEAARWCGEASRGRGIAEFAKDTAEQLTRDALPQEKRGPYSGLTRSELAQTSTCEPDWY